MNAHFARSQRHADLGRLGDRRLLRDLGYVDGKWKTERSRRTCSMQARRRAGLQGTSKNALYGAG